MKTSNIAPAILIASLASVVLYAHWREAHRAAPPPLAAIGQPGGPATSRESLDATIAAMRARITADPLDSSAAVVLADALMRQARVTGNAGLAQEADAALARVLAANPADYPALRMRGSVLLSAHRFREAIETATRARATRPHDPWNDGVIGDGHLELGEYREAFDAFDRMVSERPGAAAYARVAYARELQGNVDGAIDAMRLAADATSPLDPESQAWHAAQIGFLHLERGSTDEAEREFQRGAFAFPDHPLVTLGFARVAVARGDDRRAIAFLEALQGKAPTPFVAAELGDLYAASGRAADARRAFAAAESAWRFDAPEPAKLAVFLADHDRGREDAVRIAEDAARVRRDIFTMDAVAWTNFTAGRLREAAAAMREALGTGSRDRRLRYHAARIARARGELDAARAHARIAAAGAVRFDPRLAPLAVQLAADLDPRVVAARR